MSDTDTSATQNPSTPQILPPTTSKSITLQVGEKRFYTCEDTLSGSAMLSAMVAQRWESHKQPDGSYFVDADPLIFEHILRFLRHGVYPLCYSIHQGHDYALYTAIYKQALYFLIVNLAEWLGKQRYLEAVKTETSVQVVENEDTDFGLAGVTDSDTRVQYHPSWRIKKKYVCPRGIAVHYDNPGGCGRACRSALGEAEDQYEECPVLSTLVVKEKVVFKRQLCVEE